MLDFDIQRCTRRCAVSDRELRPGESFYSLLVSAGSEVKRQDISVEAWKEPPENAIACWKSQMPGGTGKPVHWAPHDVILDYFQRLEGDEAKADVRYVLALLMVRRRIVRWEDSEHDEHGQELLVLYSPRDETEFRVPVRSPEGTRIAEIQSELGQLLVTSGSG